MESGIHRATNDVEAIAQRRRPRGEGPRHGYAIMTDVEAITGSPMGPGTLYGALARLEKRGLIEALEPHDRRRPYRLTGIGEATVRAQLERIKGFAATGLDRLGEAST